MKVQGVKVQKHSAKVKFSIRRVFEENYSLK